jgi:uncharacterized protein YodC (DUF2158 family)
MADQFKPGDVVMLKSGGPQMTVTEVDGDRTFCQWFDEKRAAQAQCFPAIAAKTL